MTQTAETPRKGSQVKLDNRPISPEEWAKYDKQLAEWQEKYKGRTHTMEAAMMEPNEPNYFQANND